MRIFLVPIGLGVLFMYASANGVTSFGPLITWVILLGSLATILLIAAEGHDG